MSMKYWANPDEIYANEVDEMAVAQPDKFKQNRCIMLKSKDAIGVSCNKITSRPPPCEQATKKQMSEEPYKTNPKMLNKFSTNVLFYRGKIQ